MIQQIDRRDLYYGSALGLALGDALGTASHGLNPSQFETITEPRGEGAFRLQPGEWTDETSTAMCLAESLLKEKRFAAPAYRETLGSWYEHGYWSSRDFCFGVSRGIRRFIQEGVRDESLPSCNGPEVVTLVAPFALYFLSDTERMCIELRAMLMALHASEEAQQCACVLAMMIASALRGIDKDRLLSSSNGVEQYFSTPFSQKLDAILEGAYRGKPGFVIQTEGSASNALEAALWGFASTTNFKEGALAVANLGGASESAGAIYGQLAGAYYGWNGIPQNWIHTLARGEAIKELAGRLWKASLTLP